MKQSESTKPFHAVGDSLPIHDLLAIRKARGDETDVDINNQIVEIRPVLMHGTVTGHIYCMGEDEEDMYSGEELTKYGI